MLSRLGSGGLPEGSGLARSSSGFLPEIEINSFRISKPFMLSAVLDELLLNVCLRRIRPKS